MAKGGDFETIASFLKINKGKCMTDSLSGIPCAEVSETQEALKSQENRGLLDKALLGKGEVIELKKFKQQLERLKKAKRNGVSDAYHP